MDSRELPPVGRRVAYRRGRRNLSQQVFADRPGRSKSRVDKVERGVRTLDTVSTLQDIAAALRIDPVVLLGRDAQPAARYSEVAALLPGPLADVERTRAAGPAGRSALVGAYRVAAGRAGRAGAGPAVDRVMSVAANWRAGTRPGARRAAVAPGRGRQRDRAGGVPRQRARHVKDSPRTEMSGFSWRDARFAGGRRRDPVDARAFTFNKLN